MTFNKEMIEDYADKLLIGLTSEEVDLILNEFSKIDKNIDMINSIPNLNEIEPMDYCLDDFYIELNDDDEIYNVRCDTLLSNASNKTRNEVIIPKVVG